MESSRCVREYTFGLSKIEEYNHAEMGLSDEDWDELSQGIPAPGDAVLQKYLDGREGLIAEEKKKRSGIFSLELFG